jgi:murein L,D-transpeptidase YafK
MRTAALALLTLLVGAAHAEPDNSHATEIKIAKSLLDIHNDRLDVAMNEVNSVLHSYPNYKLAQLVKGDLLMAKAGAISGFGSAPHAPGDKIKDLRDEARVRLLRTLSHPETRLAPRYLWKLGEQQKYALVVDTSRSTLYVYENVDGKPRYAADFYVTIGKLGTEKLVSGDQRTPIGVYFIRASLPKKELSDIYGSGAFPLSYPNEWDRKNGRTGSGIWLHGTPSDTYSRPPRASNGCVVLNNDDLNMLAPYLQVGVTPVIITNRMAWDNSQDDADRTELLHQIELWRKDWASRDTAAYLKHYAHNFSSENADYQTWARQKQLVNASKSWIKVNLADLSLFTYPDQPDMVVVEFMQDYSSSNLSNHMKKRQYWIKKDGRWQILYEGAG